MPAEPVDRDPVVCTDRGQAVELSASGKDVVLVLAEGEALDSRPPGPGRVAVLVGDPSSDDDLAAAAAMAAEVFGAAGPGGARVDSAAGPGCAGVVGAAGPGGAGVDGAAGPGGAGVPGA